MKNYKISLGDSHDGFGIVRSSTYSWVDIVNACTTHREDDIKGGPFFVGGYFNSNDRRDVNLIARTLLTLDIDKVESDVSTIVQDLKTNLNSAFCAHSTFSHGINGKTSIRVIAPLSRETSKEEYTALVKIIKNKLSTELDACSFKPNQLMFLPSCPDKSKSWGIEVGGDPLNVDGILSSNFVENNVSDKNEFSLDIMSEISDSEIDSYLSELGGECKNDYHDWLMVGQSLHHQYNGSSVGLDKWLKWSSSSDKFDEETLRYKWSTFKRSDNCVTFRSVIYKVNRKLEVEGLNVIDSLIEEASKITSIDEYRTFKDKVLKIPAKFLGTDDKGIIASRLYNTIGKREGMSKSEIKKSLTASRSKIVKDKGEWVSDWVYIETSCEFYNIEKGYGIKREAFNAKYDREPECRAAEKQAHSFALIDCKIPTVVDSMYYPGANTFFEFDGKSMLNSYNERGCELIGEDDPNYSEVVGSFLNHLDLTLSDEEEKTIFLDWLCYIVQNPGKRVNWAMLLQGAQGIGKTYFVNLLQYIMGTNVKNLDPNSISGRFTSWASGSIVNAVEEIRISGSNKYEILDRMKPFITNDTVMIEEKGKDHKTVRNFTSYFLLTNHLDAVPLSHGDRRYCVLFSRVQSEIQLYEELGGRAGAEEYFNTLFTSLDRFGGCIAHYLKNRKVSITFSPRGRAPNTSAREAMLNLAISPERCEVENAITDHGEDNPIISKNILDITTLNNLCQLNGETLPYGRKLSRVLLDLGYRQIHIRKIKICKTRKNHYIWVNNGTTDQEAIDTVRDYFLDEK